jgi:meiotic recombination protein REC8
MEFGPPSALTRRHGSRLASASPLLGRGGTMTRYSSFELLEKPDLMSGEAGDSAFERAGMQLGDDDLVDDPEFQLYGPAAAVDTQTAAQSQWVVGALDTEAHNFLAFLRAEIAAKIVGAERAGGQLEDEDAETVTFEGLLPPEQHSKVVASQGLLHVLSLVTKGLIVVRQEEAFAKIEIGVVTVEEEDEAHGEEMED